MSVELPETSGGPGANAPAFSVEEAERIAAELGHPVVIRPAYTLGGTGGGLVYNVEELELEVVRDARNQMITVCFIENVDAMGVHTGDSYCTAPMLTISPELQADLQEKSYRIVEAIQVIGGTNIQFARWAFEKFRGAEDKLGTQMRAVSEVMSIGKTYKEALQKSIRSLENGRYGLGFARDFHKKPLAKLMDMGGTASRRSPCKNCTKGARTSWTSSRTGRFT